MTIYLPLDPKSPLPPSPSFLVPSSNHAAHLSRVFQAILKARRIVVICGAGISVQAGIPDFRSSDGLFQSIKRDNPREALSSGKELFDVSVFNSEQKTLLFCQMIAQLSDLSQAAQPTSFHHVLRALDDRGRLLRVYTQNIDAIEQKSGLSFGVPEFEGKRAKSRSKAKPTAVAVEEIGANAASDQQQQHANVNESAGPVASTSRLPSPPAETPRCIPLHGTLQSMHCQICNHSFPLQEYLPSLNSGVPPPCPECTSLEATRQLVGKRPRGIGRLRPSVVLYNEAHKDGEGVGNVVQKDLIGASKGKGRSGADLLLVVGTSLRVPGTKRMVREFAKAVRSRGVGSSSSSAKDEQPQHPSTPGNRNANSSRNSSGLATPAPSPRRSPTADDESASATGSSASVPMKAIYLNLDFPMPTREWEGVFDAWIQGDAQEFAEMLRAEIEKEARAKEVVVERKMKKKREEEQEQEQEEMMVANAAAEAMLDLAGEGKLRPEEEEGQTEDELPDYGRMLLEREKKAKENGKKQHGTTSAKRKFGHGSKNAATLSSSSSSSTSSLSSSSSAMSSSSSSLLTPPTPTSLGKRKKVALPLSPPRTPIIRGKRKEGGEVSLPAARTTATRGRGQGRNNDEDRDVDVKNNDDDDNEQRKKARSKLLVRIPSRTVQYRVPEVYIKTKPPPPQPHYRTVYDPPQYVRPYEFLRGSGSMDVDVDMDMAMDVDIVGEEESEVNRAHAHASHSPSVRYASSASRVSERAPAVPPHYLPLNHHSNSRPDSQTMRGMSLSPVLSRHPYSRSPVVTPRSPALPPPALPAVPRPPHIQTQTMGMPTALPTPPRLNDHHRLGGRIDHSHTLLNLRMARTSLQLGVQDSA